MREALSYLLAKFRDARIVGVLRVAFDSCPVGCLHDMWCCRKIGLANLESDAVRKAGSLVPDDSNPGTGHAGDGLG